jgi:hypothetical protein
VREKPGKVLSPHVQVQGGIKITYQETSVLLFPFPQVAEWVIPLTSIKLFYLTASLCAAWVLPFEMQGPRSSENMDC